MAFDTFLDHKCSVYHIVKTTTNIGYNLVDKVVYKYGDDPDLSDVNCHFAVGASTNFNQKQPQNEYTTDIKLTLPAGTDIREFDKVVWQRDSGENYEYTAKIPRNIRDHHMIAIVERIGLAQKAL